MCFTVMGCVATLALTVSAFTPPSVGGTRSCVGPRSYCFRWKKYNLPLLNEKTADDTHDALGDVKPPSPPSLNDIGEVARRVAASAVLMTTIIFGNSVDLTSLTEVPSSEIYLPFIRLNTANAAVAPVILREFVVKDGNELLRLGLPTSMQTNEGSLLIEKGGTGQKGKDEIY